MQTIVIGSNGGVGAAIVDILLANKQEVTGATLSGKDKYSRGFSVMQFNALFAAEYEKLPKAEIIFGAFNASKYTAAVWELEFNQFIDNFIAYGKSTKTRLVFIDNLYSYKLSSEHPISETSEVSPSAVLGKIRQAVAAKFLTAAKAGEINGIIIRGSDLYGPYSLNTTVGERFFSKLYKENTCELLPIANEPHMYTYTSDFADCAVFCALDSKVNSGEVIIAPASEPVAFKNLINKIVSLSGQNPKWSKLPKFILQIGSIFDPMLKSVSSMGYEWESPFLVDYSKYKKINPDFKVTSLDKGLAQTVAWFKLKVK